MSAAAETNPPVVTLTPGAVERVRSLLAGEIEGGGKGLRLFIEQGGCSGMQYSMQFDGPREGDLVAEFDGVSVLVDPVSADYLRGAIVDFKDELTGGGFKITNPNARQSCGCGKSFET
jgi:iron-sulfur cluster assembly accessory protein